ncbi:MAG: ATP-dependent DNA helicase [Cytophagales bacterium]|nr:MAG: ATP-dependent DNA helicase [Cytophagales bacterium]TAF60425.1 MAG: ATP-dependent DNA helicase [Cytophagales bacterium]
MNDFLSQLNESQREAVVNTQGPCLVVAGAGSGKTRVLTFRIAYLLQNGVEPYQILALTFTNKAAREMKKRIEELVGTEAKSLWMGTFHSIFARILRIESQLIGYDSNFTIYDTDDSKSLLKSIIKDFALDDKKYNANNLLNRISNCKNNLVTHTAYAQNEGYREEDRLAQRPEFGRVYAEYVRRCKSANAMDFDDLLLQTNVLFKNHPEAAEKYQNKFQYVLVDEFQDTNLSQYLILRRLANKHRNICVVGDDAQSIYAFRGADIRNILNFERDYKSLKTIKLEQNYRSTQSIIEAANEVINHNRDQIKKRVWTENPQGERIDLLKATSDAEEARLIASSIFETKVNKSLTSNDFAILYRTNAQSRALEEALRTVGIKYRIFGGLSFYQRKEIKDLAAYWRFSVNSADVEAFKRIVNLPKRGIGQTSIDKLVQTALEVNLPLWDVVSAVDKYLKLPAAGTKALKEFALLVQSFREQVASKDAYKAAVFIAKNSGLLKELHEDQTVEGRARYENVQELLNAVKQFCDNPDNPDKSMPAFLQQIALVTSGDDVAEDEEAVTLMTIHAAKGLEFNYVYVPGMEESLFPSSRMIGTRADLEEERRLFYVAITRAKRKLTLSYALQRYYFGSLKPCEASRFLSEIDKDLFSVPKMRQNSAATSYMTRFAREREKSHNSSYSVETALPAEQEQTGRLLSPQDIKSGLEVVHLKFGRGLVLSVEDSVSGKRAMIKFDTVGEKAIMLNFAKLKTAD